MNFFTEVSEYTKQECCICGIEFFGWGNNPYPVMSSESGACCESCKDTEVIQAKTR